MTIEEQLNQAKELLKERDSQLHRLALENRRLSKDLDAALINIAELREQLSRKSKYEFVEIKNNKENEL